eukprot:403370488
MLSQQYQQSAFSSKEQKLFKKKLESLNEANKKQNDKNNEKMKSDIIGQATLQQQIQETKSDQKSTSKSRQLNQHYEKRTLAMNKSLTQRNQLHNNLQSSSKQSNPNLVRSFGRVDTSEDSKQGTFHAHRYLNSFDEKDEQSMKIQIVEGNYGDDTLTFNQNVMRQSEVMLDYRKRNLRPVTGFETNQFMAGHLSYKFNTHNNITKNKGQHHENNQNMNFIHQSLIERQTQLLREADHLYLREILQKGSIISEDEREYLTNFVIKGVPDGLRGRFWRVASNAQTIIDDIQFKQYYPTLSNEFPDYPNPSLHQIEIDLKRTFPDDEYYQLPGVIKSIRRILVSYTKRNPIVGYCQGMNYIVGRLIKYLSEEETFWVFTQLIESILPIDFYTHLIGVQTETKIFKQFVKEYLPQIDEKFQEFNFDTMLFTLNWFICIFSDKLSENVSLAIIDLIMLKGCNYIQNIALAILYLMRDKILEAEAFSDLFMVFENHQEYIKSHERLLFLAVYGTKEFRIPRGKIIQRLRNLTSQEYVESQPFTLISLSHQNDKSFVINEEKLMLQKQVKKQQFFNKFNLFGGLQKLRTLELYRNREDLFINTEGKNSFNLNQMLSTQEFEDYAIQHYVCNSNWPICIYDLTYRALHPQYFCFTTAKPLHIIQDYFSVQLFDEIGKVQKELEIQRDQQKGQRNLELPRDSSIIDIQFVDMPNNDRNMIANIFQNQLQSQLKNESEVTGLRSLTSQQEFIQDSELQNNIKYENLRTSELCKQLLVYRGQHYCDNHEFINRFRHLFKQGDNSLLSNKISTGKGFLNAKESIEYMKEFILITTKGRDQSQQLQGLSIDLSQLHLPQFGKTSKIFNQQVNQSFTTSNRMSRTKLTLQNKQYSHKHTQEFPEEFKDFGVIQQLNIGSNRLSKNLMSILSNKNDSDSSSSNRLSRNLNRTMNRLSPTIIACATQDKKSSKSSKHSSSKITEIKKRPKSQILSKDDHQQLFRNSGKLLNNKKQINGSPQVSSSILNNWMFDEKIQQIQMSNNTADIYEKIQEFKQLFNQKMSQQQNEQNQRRRITVDSITNRKSTNNFSRSSRQLLRKSKNL